MSRRESSGRVDYLNSLGGPRELTVQLAGVAGIVFVAWLCWKAFEAYPLAALNNLKASVPGLVVGCAAGALIARRRDKIMAWGARAPLLRWLAVLSCAMLVAMATTGLVYLTNGALDKADPIEVELVVVQKSTYRDRYRLHVQPKDNLSMARWQLGLLHVSRQDFDRLEPGSDIVAVIGKGFLGLPWRRGYRIPSG